MKVLVAAAVMATVLCFGQAVAVESDNRKAAEELLTLTNAERSVSDLRSQVGQMMTAQLQSMNVPESMRDKVAKFQQQLLGIIFEEMTFEKMKPAYVDVYSSTFTLDELAGLVAFYKGPIGRAYADKMPTLMKRMMEVSQAKMQALAPRLKKMNEDFIADLMSAASPH